MLKDINMVKEDYMYVYKLIRLPVRLSLPV